MFHRSVSSQRRLRRGALSGFALPGLLFPMAVAGRIAALRLRLRRALGRCGPFLLARGAAGSLLPLGLRIGPGLLGSRLVGSLGSAGRRGGPRVPDLSAHLPAPRRAWPPVPAHAPVCGPCVPRPDRWPAATGRFPTVPADHSPPRGLTRGAARFLVLIVNTLGSWVGHGRLSGRLAVVAVALTGGGALFLVRGRCGGVGRRGGGRGLAAGRVDRALSGEHRGAPDGRPR